MKTVFKVLAIAALAAVTVSSMTTCDNGTTDNGGGGRRRVHILNVSRDTDWDLLVFGNSGESILLDVDMDNAVPTRMFYRPDKDKDAAFSFLFKENGLPDKVIFNDYIICYENFNGYTYDMAVINPKGEINYIRDIQGDTNWDVYKERSVSSRGRSVSGRHLADLFSKEWWTKDEGTSDTINKCLELVGHGLGIGTCVGAVAFVGLAVPLDGMCISYLVGEMISMTVDVLSKVWLDDLLGDDVANDAASLIQDAIGCTEFATASTLSKLVKVNAAFSCIRGLGDLADMIMDDDLGKLIKKIKKVDEATDTLDNNKVSNPTAVTWNSLTANGTANLEDTTTLTFTFNKAPTNLSVGDIMVTGAAKGSTLFGGGTTRTLSIRNLDVSQGGNVTVTLTNPAGYRITPSTRTVTINRDTAADFAGTWTANDGEKIVMNKGNFTFSNNDGDFLKGTFTSSGTRLVVLAITHITGAMLGNDALPMGLSATQWYTRQQLRTAYIRYGVSPEEVDAVLGDVFSPQQGVLLNPILLQMWWWGNTSAIYTKPL